MEKCIQCNAQCTALQNENEQKTKQSLKLITEKKLPAEWAENNKVQKDQRDFVVT